MSITLAGEGGSGELRPAVKASCARGNLEDEEPATMARYRNSAGDGTGKTRSQAEERLAVDWYSPCFGDQN